MSGGLGLRRLLRHLRARISPFAASVFPPCVEEPPQPWNSLPRDILEFPAKMAQTRTLPRICIALGLPDVPTLLDHARREAEAGETFLEFRLDFLNSPARGAEAIAKFLDQFPDSIIVATCRRHQNHGRFNGSIDEQLAILDLAVRSGAHAIDVEIETAEAAKDRLHQFRGRAQVIVSYHNFEATPPIDTVVTRIMKVQADAYKIVTTASKPSDNVRVPAAAKGLPKQRV